MWETAEAISQGFAWEADVRRIESKDVMDTGVNVDVVAIINSRKARMPFRRMLGY